jgi:hypothetical protein
MREVFHEQLYIVNACSKQADMLQVRASSCPWLMAGVGLIPRDSCCTALTIKPVHAALPDTLPDRRRPFRFF